MSNTKNSEHNQLYAVISHNIKKNVKTKRTYVVYYKMNV